MDLRPPFSVGIKPKFTLKLNSRRLELQRKRFFEHGARTPF